MKRNKLMIYGLLLLTLAALGLWAYKVMIDIRPEVSRPQLDPSDHRMVDDLQGRLEKHVTTLADDIGSRNVFEPDKLDSTAGYIHAFWEETGYEVTVQNFDVAKVTCRNLAVEILGKTKPDEIVLVGAHYDTVPGSPGANDNGSAVASLLELSRLFRSMSPEKTIRLVAFANEEPPFFKTRLMGSFVYARECRRREENINAMICLETIGYYRDEPRTQKYPVPFGFFYPRTGNFVAVVGNLRSKSLVQSFARYFMEESDFPLECVSTFGFLTGIDWSDHWSFWRFGYPAVMITDTALFRYPFYHSELDTPEKLNYPALARVTHGLYRALVKMAYPTPSQQ